jgi:hypothetical protein
MYCQLDLGIWLSVDGFILKTAAGRCLTDITHLLLRILPYLDIHCFVLISRTELRVCTYYYEVAKMFALPLFTVQLLNSSSVLLLLSSSKDVLASSFYCTIPKSFTFPLFYRIVPKLSHFLFSNAHFQNCSHCRFLLHSF